MPQPKKTSQKFAVTLAKLSYLKVKKGKRGRSGDNSRVTAPTPVEEK